MSDQETNDARLDKAGSDDLDKQTDEIMEALNSMLAQQVGEDDSTDVEPQVNQEARASLADLVPSPADDDHAQETDDRGLDVIAPVVDKAGDQADAGAAGTNIEIAPVVEPNVVADASVLDTIVGETAVTQGQPAAAQPLAEADTAKRRRWPTVFLALLVLAAAVYLAGVVGFMHYFMPNTTLNGEDVSLSTLNDVAQRNTETIDTFGLSITGDGLDVAIEASDIKAKYDGRAFARAAIAQQHPWRWPLELSGTHQLEVESSLIYDAVRLDDLVGSAVDVFNKDAKEPVDASITYNKESKRYEVKPEEAGTKIDRSKVIELVRAAIKAGEQQIELDEEQLVQPQIVATDASLTEPVKKVNASLDATQELIRGDDVVATVGVDDIEKWVKVDDELNVTFDEEACTKWCRGELSEKIDTVGSKRTFKTPDGRELTVSGGTYGWNMNGAEVAAKIAENVRAGKQAQIELTWITEGKTWNPGGNEWGDTYVEIDLGAQHVRFFREGQQVWESDCVSGGPLIDGKDRSTPPGIYYVNDNMRSGNIELRGEIDPKTNQPSYISYVKYWMPFIGDSVALHDADWRSSFGGTIYQSNGSHGCVNLPPSAAAELYGMVGVGTVVVVHS